MEAPGRSAAAPHRPVPDRREHRGQGVVTRGSVRLRDEVVVVTPAACRAVRVRRAAPTSRPLAGRRPSTSADEVDLAVEAAMVIPVDPFDVGDLCLHRGPTRKAPAPLTSSTLTARRTSGCQRRSSVDSDDPVGDSHRRRPRAVRRRDVRSPVSGSASSSHPSGRPGGIARRHRFPRARAALNVLAGLFLIPLGVLLVAVGQSDDSPGLGGIGWITALIGVVMLLRVLVKRRSP